MLYFAYGSNMSRGPMRRRCPTAKELGVAVLRNHRFVIMANGYASVVPSEGQDVYGVLWRIGPRDLAALDAYEDIAGGLYRHATMPVLYQGEAVDALVYVGCETREGRARGSYMAGVIAAAREYALPEAYIASLRRFAPGAGG